MLYYCGQAFCMPSYVSGDDQHLTPTDGASGHSLDIGPLCQYAALALPLCNANLVGGGVFGTPHAGRLDTDQRPNSLQDKPKTRVSNSPKGGPHHNQLQKLTSFAKLRPSCFLLLSALALPSVIVPCPPSKSVSFAAIFQRLTWEPRTNLDI
jgi:hypothetical protein